MSARQCDLRLHVFDDELEGTIQFIIKKFKDGFWEELIQWACPNCAKYEEDGLSLDDYIEHSSECSARCPDPR